MVDEDVCVLVPTLDEAATIADVVAGFRAEGFERVLVVDGGSTDGTPERATGAGAEVIQQTGSGKGQAVMEGVSYADADIVVLVDGDGTYDPADAERLVEPIRSGRADHVVGNRFGDLRPGAMTRLNRLGNRLINRTFRFIHGTDYGDILSGYRAFTRSSVADVHLTATGFGIETELAVECAKRDLDTVVVPITYRPRPAGSEANLRPFRDGAVIFATLYRLAKTNNPLFYFGSVGTVSGVFGLVLGGYVGYEWVAAGVSHEVLAVLAGVALLFGLQLVMFGVLSDMLLALHREQLRRLE